MSDRVQQAIERLRRIKNDESLESVYNDSGQYNSFTCRIGLMTLQLEKDRKILADAYLAEHAPKPLEVYLEFANVLLTEDVRLDLEKLDDQMDKLIQEKEVAVINQDFETAKQLRHQTDKLKKRMDSITKDDRDKQNAAVALARAMHKRRMVIPNE